MDSDDMKSKLQHAYETLLSHVEEFLDSEKTTLGEAVQKAKSRLYDLGELSREEIDDISDEFARDLKRVGETAHEMSESMGNALKMDTMYITEGILDRLKMVADKTSLELMQLNEELAKRIREREQQEQPQKQGNDSPDNEEQQDV
ncbi:MAG: hypothetical protein ABFR19_08255, partial [Pseudomonadota bacterium]